MVRTSPLTLFRPCGSIVSSLVKDRAALLAYSTASYGQHARMPTENSPVLCPRPDLVQIENFSGLWSRPDFVTAGFRS